MSTDEPPITPELRAIADGIRIEVRTVREYSIPLSGWDRSRANVYSRAASRSLLSDSDEASLYRWLLWRDRVNTPPTHDAAMCDAADILDALRARLESGAHPTKVWSEAVEELAACIAGVPRATPPDPARQTRRPLSIPQQMAQYPGELSDDVQAARQVCPRCWSSKISGTDPELGRMLCGDCLFAWTT